MKNDNRTAAARPTTARNPAPSGRAEAKHLPDCLANLATPATSDRRPARGRIEPNRFSRAEMRAIVLEMIG